MNTQFRSHVLVLAGAFAVLAKTSVFAQHHGGGSFAPAQHIGGGGLSSGQRGVSANAVAPHHSTGVASHQLSSGGQFQPSSQSTISRNVMPSNGQANSSTSFLSRANSPSGLSNNLSTSSGSRSPNSHALSGISNQPPSGSSAGHSTSANNGRTNLPPNVTARTNQVTSNFGAKNLPPSGTTPAKQSTGPLVAKNSPPTKIGQKQNNNQVANGVAAQKSNKDSFNSSKNLSLDDLVKQHQSKQLNAKNVADSKAGLANLGATTGKGSKNGLPNQVAELPKNAKFPANSNSTGSGSGGSGAGGSESMGQGGMNSLQILSTYLVVPIGGIPFGGYGGGYGGGYAYGGAYGADFDPICYVGTDPGAMGAPIANTGSAVGYSDPGVAKSPIANSGVASVYSGPVVSETRNISGSTAMDAQVVLALPTSAGGSLNFGIDGVGQTIAPGTASAFTLSNGSKGEISFDNGVGTDRRYTLTSGDAYEFYVKDGAWDLRQKTISPPVLEGSVAQGQIRLMHFASDAPPVYFSISGETDSIAPGATKSVDLANTVKSEISFDNGAGSAMRYTVTAGQVYEFFAKDGAWDLREKAIQPAQTPEKPHLITGRFAVINPPENKIPLSFKVNGEARTVTAGNLQIVTTFDNEVPKVAVAGPDGREAEVPVSAGKIYEFWDKDGAWDLREKVLIASESNANGDEETKVSGS
jgi:hypothetical protein